MDDEETRKILNQNARKIGREIGNEIIDANGFYYKNDEKTVHLINALGESMIQQGTCNLPSNLIVEKEVFSCSFQTWTKEFCYQYESFIQGMLEVINPELEPITV